MSGIGTKDFEKIFVGDKEVTSVFVGNAKVYSKEQPPVVEPITYIYADTSNASYLDGESTPLSVHIVDVVSPVTVKLDGNFVATVSSDTTVDVSVNTAAVHIITLEGGKFSISGNILGGYDAMHRLTNVVFGSNVEALIGATFYYATNLQIHLVLPEGMKEVSQSAFNDAAGAGLAAGITGITLPSTMTTVWTANPFEGCKNMSQFVSNNSNYTTLDNGKLLVSGNKIVAAAMSGLTSYSIPNNINITTIGNRAFTKFNNLASVTIPSNISTIEQYAFAECTSLNNVVIPSNVTSIGTYVFRNCDALLNTTFNHTAAQTITLDTKVFYAKTARNMTVNYYGNSTVANYDYSGDNITATLNLIS